MPKRARKAALVATLRVGDSAELSLGTAEALQFIVESGHSAEIEEALFEAWGRMSEETRASVCLGLGERFVPDLLQLDADRVRPVAASCLASEGLHGALRGVGPDPAEHAGFVREAISISALNGPHCADSRRALLRACVMLDELTTEVRSVVDRELVEWARTFDEHRDVAVLRAVLRATHRCGPKLSAWLTRAPLEEHLPLRSAASKVDTETATGMAIGWLGWSSLVPVARKVIDRVAANPTHDSVTALLEPWGLLRARRRSQRLPKVLSLDAFRSLARTTGLSAHARRGLIEVAACLGTAALAQLIEHGMVADPDESVRLALIQAISRAEAFETGDSALQDLGFDREEVLARASVGAMSRVRSRHRRRASVTRLRSLARSPIRSVREHARRTIERFDLLGAARSPDARWLNASVGTWMAHRAPDTLRDELNGALADPARVDACLKLVQRLGFVADSVDQVAHIALHDTEPSARASATLLLGRIDGIADAAVGERIFRALADLLVDDDDRVRANAIEAMSRLRAADLRLDRFAGDDQPRIRANAVLHACRHDGPKDHGTLADSAMLQLDAMLHDDRPEHRVSALWVARQIRPVEMATQIAGMAQDDPDPIVRSRARRCAGRLLSAMEPQTREVGVA